MAIKTAMMAMTTSSSISVNPRDVLERMERTPDEKKRRKWREKRPGDHDLSSDQKTRSRNETHGPSFKNDRDGDVEDGNPTPARRDLSIGRNHGAGMADETTTAIAVDETAFPE
jgi:hypothetical protein